VSIPCSANATSIAAGDKSAGKAMEKRLYDLKGVKTRGPRHEASINIMKRIQGRVRVCTHL
jgi:hypothetical protein